MNRLFLSIKNRLLLYSTSLFQKMLKSVIKTNSEMMVFIPRGGGMITDGYDYFNYTSDNALALLHYMIGKYGNRFVYRLACDVDQYERLHSLLKNITTADIDCFPYFRNLKVFSLKKFSPIFAAKYIFMSETIPLYSKKKSQKVFFLTYFVPFKDDYGHDGYPLVNMNRMIDFTITTSKLSSYIISTTYDFSFSKCHVFGFSRNDCLLENNNNEELERFIKESVDYDVKKVLLYTPTHRDYERGSKIERKLLGFDIDNQRLGTMLREKGAIIICKIHTTQNKDVLDLELPTGVVVYTTNEKYGLCELMKRADCLITDYTSTYFDYLLLDRPVLFNFYDYDIYEKTRGFSYDPLEPFLAGEIFYDETSFFDKISVFLSGIDNYATQRQMIRDIHHKYKDSNSSERICKFIFGE